MTDIASLGIKIDSAQATQASGALDHLAAISKNTAATVGLLEKMARSASTALDAVKTSGKDASTSIDAVQKSASGATSVLEGFAKALDGAVSNIRDMTSVGQRGLDDMRAKFDPLFAAGQKYKQTLGDIRDAHRAGAITSNQMAEAIMNTKVAFVEQTNALRGNDKYFETANESSKKFVAGTGLARHELINLSRQIQDVGVSLVSGQSPFMVLAQQGAQIADIFGSSKTGTVGGAIKQVASGIASFLTPMRVLGLGVAATGIAAVAAYGNWKTYTLQLDDTAKQANTTTRELSALQAAAGFKGISGEDFTKGIQSFSQQIYLAKQNAGGLLDVFRANGVQVSTFNGSLEKAADLIQRAKDDQARLVLLQQMGLPANMQWVRLMSDGADGIRKAKAAAAEFSADDNMINRARAFDEAWNRTWTNFSLNARSAFQRALDGGANFFDRMERLANRAGNASFWSGLYDQKSAAAAGVSLTNNFDGRMSGDMANPASGNTALQDALRRKADALNNKTTVDPNAVKNALAVEQQRIGILGQTASVLDQVRNVEIQIQQARLNGVKISASEAERLKKNAEDQALGTAAIKAATDAQKIEADVIGMSTGQATAHAAAQNAINDAKRAGRPLTEDNIATIRAEATALGEAAQRAEQMRWGYESLVRGPMQAFQQQLAQGATFFDAFKASGISALNAISSKLMDMAAQNLWKSAFGGSGGGFGGLLGGLFGGGSPSISTGLGAGTGGMAFPTFHTGFGPGDAIKNTRYVHPAHFNDAPRFHSGIGPGERAAIIRTDESVLTPGQMKALGNGAGVGAAQPVNITNNYTFNGVEPGMEARMRAYIDQGDQRSVTQAVQATQKTAASTPAYRGAFR